jgi:hypothetical protein
MSFAYHIKPSLAKWLAAHFVAEFFHVMCSNLSTGNSFSSDWIGLDLDLIQSDSLHISAQPQSSWIDPTACKNLGRIDPTSVNMCDTVIGRCILP